MPESSEKHPSHWQELAENPQPILPGLRRGQPELPGELKVKLTHGAWFGAAMGIGFAIGFLISFLFLVGIVGFIIYSKFPGLFS